MTPRERIDAAWYGLTKKRMEAIIVEAEEAARAEERERCCRDVCEACRTGIALCDGFGSYHSLAHLGGSVRVECHAAAIRSRSTTPDAKFVPCGTCLACKTSGNTACERQPRAQSPDAGRVK